MIYTNVPKPTSTPYTNLNTQGKEQYDQNLAYDDSGTFYDGTNPGQYTSVSKPTLPTYTKVNKPT